jgi:uncharacterized protein
MDMDNKERRFGDIELRAKDDGSESRTIRGYAAKFNKDSENLGRFIERIAPGAFDDVLNDDVVALFNHDPNIPLSRTGAGLKIGTDDVGLYYEFDAPHTTAGNDLLANVRSGVIKQSSFAFTVKEDKWLERKGQPTLRTIVKAERLYDVSPVTYPAYPDTTVAARSLSQITNEYQKDLAEMDLDRMRRDLRK